MEAGAEEMMLEELERIDVSAIEELEAIKKEQESLTQRLEELAARKADVSPQVFERVRSDYETRNEKLEATAQPLKQRARAAYGVLRGLIEQMEEDLRKATLSSEELKLRHELGEYDDKEFGERRQESEERLQLCQTLLERGNELKATFVGAFHSEEELESDKASPPPPPEMPPPPPTEDEPPEAEPVEDEDSDSEKSDAEPVSTEEDDSSEESVEAEEEDEDQPDLEHEGTVLLDKEEMVEEDDDDDNYKTQDDSEVDMDSESTAVTPQPRLIEVQDDGDGKIHPLRVPITTVGRLNVNHICVADGTVSRNHAKIVVSDQEITIYDLASENGVFVNEKQITEHILVSGDRIQFGAAKLLFEFRTD